MSGLISLTIILGTLILNPATAAEVKFNSPFGVGVRANGSFMVAESRGNPGITKFDAAGNYLGRITEIDGYGKLGGPFDVDIAQSGNIYIADTLAHRVLVLNPSEKLMLKIGTGQATAEPAGFHEPHFIAANEKLGLIYVADTHNNRLQIFDMQGKLLKILGKSGLREPGTYLFSNGVTCDEDGYVYAMNWSGGFINVYNPKWELIESFGRDTPTTREFNDAYCVTLRNDTIWVTNTFSSRLRQYSKDWKLLKVVGTTEGCGPNQFSHPTDLEFDAQGNMYVADWKNDRVLKLDPTGKFLRQWGSPADVGDYQPPKIIKRNPYRAPVTMATFSGIGKAGVDAAAQADVDWIYVSFNNEDKEWNIKQKVDYAHKKGVKVSASLAIYHMGSDLDRWQQHPEFYMGKKGEPLGRSLSLSYFFPEVRSWKAKHIAAQTKKSGIDGIMLDYIRYPNNICGYEPAMVEAFKKETGRDANKIAPDDEQWLQFRSKYITMFISELRYELAQLDRPIELSVYVGPDWKEALTNVVHNWRDWVRMGIIDKVCLGLYSRDFASFYEGVLQARSTCPDRTMVSIIIACWGGNLYTPELLKKGADVSFAADADELVVYRGDAIEYLNIWPTIGEISRKYKNVK